MNHGQKHMPDHDPQDTGPQYLEDLATAYWQSRTLFAAVEADLFTFIGLRGSSAEEIAAKTGFSISATERFLHALCSMGLLSKNGDSYFNTRISDNYLVSGKPNCQRASILWRRNLSEQWENIGNCLKSGGRTDYLPDEDAARLAQRRRDYISAMDCTARTKAQEILPFFRGLALSGEVLDVGAGSGAVAAAFLEEFPGLHATLMDIPEVLDIAGELIKAKGLAARVSLCPADILKPWPIDNSRFDLIVLSNIIHVYSEKELPHILASAANSLSEDGCLVIHDFFLEHHPRKAALFDLNMLINTYNGRVFSQEEVCEALSTLGLHTLPFPLDTDTAIVFGAKVPETLHHLLTDTTKRLASSIRNFGINAVSLVPVDIIHVTDWAGLKCRFGCGKYGSPHCPPNSLDPQKTRELLSDYSRALILEGEPPTRAFQERVLKAEHEAFKLGFHKALAFWAGPCSFCDSCSTDGKCRNTRDSRQSMEGAGIDVYETVRRAGFRVRTLDSQDDFVKYYALLLLE